MLCLGLRFLCLCACVTSPLLLRQFPYNMRGIMAQTRRARLTETMMTTVVSAKNRQQTNNFDTNVIIQHNPPSYPAHVFCLGNGNISLQSITLNHILCILAVIVQWHVLIYISGVRTFPRHALYSTLVSNVLHCTQTFKCEHIQKDSSTFFPVVEKKTVLHLTQNPTCLSSLLWNCTLWKLCLFYKWKQRVLCWQCNINIHPFNNVLYIFMT